MIVVGAASAALASTTGPEWEERIGADAGPLPASAQPVGKIGGGPLSAIRGELAGSGFLGTDFQDMYLIRIDSPAAFVAEVDPSVKGAFDTQLWLFRVDPGNGFGLLANDDDTSLAGGASLLRPVATDGSGAVIPSPGFYLLAISGSDSDPVSVAGEIFAMPAGSTEISGPDGPGGSAGSVTSWTADGESGPYRILLTGCSLIDLAPACPGDFDENGMVDFVDVLTLLSEWGPCPACPFDLDGDFVTGFSDLLFVLQAWGPCPGL